MIVANGSNDDGSLAAIGMTRTTRQAADQQSNRAAGCSSRVVARNKGMFLFFVAVLLLTETIYNHKYMLCIRTFIAAGAAIGTVEHRAAAGNSP